MMVLIGSCGPDKYRVADGTLEHYNVEIVEISCIMRLDPKKRPASDQIQMELVKVVLRCYECYGMSKLKEIGLKLD